jgi:hypothetical protein
VTAWQQGVAVGLLLLLPARNNFHMMFGHIKDAEQQPGSKRGFVAVVGSHFHKQTPIALDHSTIVQIILKSSKTGCR